MTSFNEASQSSGPLSHRIILCYEDGSPLGVSMADLDELRLYSSRLAINFGSQVGATLLILLMLLLLTKADKRKSFVFLSNALCLLLNLVRCILLCCFSTGGFSSPYFKIMGDTSHIMTLDLGVTIATNIFTLLVTLLVISSLSMQAWIACVTIKPLHRNTIMGVICGIATITLCLKTTLVVVSIKQTLIFQDMGAYEHLIWKSIMLQAVTFWLFSAVFTYRLGYTVLQRQRMKMAQHGPIQVVFIMGCQTMIIPAIFSCLQFNGTVPEFASQALTIVCIFLPLSALWASKAQDVSSNPTSQQVPLFNNGYASHTVRLSQTSTSTVSNVPSSTVPAKLKVDVDGNGSFIEHDFGKDTASSV